MVDLPQHATRRGEKIARFRELNPSQKALMLSAGEGGRQVHGRGDPVQVDGTAVPRRPAQPVLALAMTEPEEKAERYQLMQQFGISELDAAFKVAEKIDRARGINSLPLDALD